MIEEKFVADNPKSAYEDAVRKYGKEIKLLSAKQVKHDDGKLYSEVTVSVPEVSHVEERKNEEEILLSEVHLLKAQLAQMQQTMSKKLKQNLQVQTKEEYSATRKVRDIFVGKGIAPEWIDRVLDTLKENTILKDEKLLTSYILEEIDESLNIKEERLDIPKIIMLVGPTGVGKTTTIAKLAARYAYMLDKSYSVAFLNVDNYKIGAFDQLGHYADIMQIEHISVEDLEGFSEGIEALQKYDIILVDTAGMSPYDTEKLIRTVEYVQTDKARKIEINLLLPATVKYEDMCDIYENFSFLNLHSLMISKFDETKYLGTLLSFMLLYPLPVSYFSTGQEVPDDLLVASKEYLLERFIGDIEERDK